MLVARSDSCAGKNEKVLSVILLECAWIGMLFLAEVWIVSSTLFGGMPERCKCLSAGLVFDGLIVHHFPGYIPHLSDIGGDPGILLGSPNSISRMQEFIF